MIYQQKGLLYEHKFSLYSLCSLNICPKICSNILPPNYISTEMDFLSAQIRSLKSLQPEYLPQKYTQISFLQIIYQLKAIFYEHRFSICSLCILNICSKICSNILRPNSISTEGFFYEYGFSLCSLSSLDICSKICSISFFQIIYQLQGILYQHVFSLYNLSSLNICSKYMLKCPLSKFIYQIKRIFYDAQNSVVLSLYSLNILLKNMLKNHFFQIIYQPKGIFL